VTSLEVDLLLNISNWAGTGASFLLPSLKDSGSRFMPNRRNISLMKNHPLPTIAVFLLLLLAMSGSAKTKTITITGWVSDENCGALHTKPGGEDCVLKCLKGGAHVGHPEWKPQRMVLVTDEGQKIWVIQNPEALKGLEGKHVTVTGQLNSATKKIRVASASEIKTA
jgi:hypothetical protein